MERNTIVEEMKKYEPNQFELYSAEAGWECWMNNYTKAEDGEEATESEIKEIEKIQKKLWDEAHNVDN